MNIKNNIFSIIVALFVAFVIGYGIFVALDACGMSMADGNASTLKGAAIGYYTSQHITFSGSGEIEDDFGDIVMTKATITLPVMGWAIIPGFAFMVAGFVMSKMNTKKSMLSLLVCSFITSLIYAGAIYFAAPHISGGIDNNTLPTIGEVEFSLPELDYSPVPTSAFFTGLAFSFIFTYIGALLAMRRHNKSSWHNSFAGTFISLCLIVILSTLLLVGYYFKSLTKNDVSFIRFAQMAPMVTNLICETSFGADLSLDVTAEMEGTKPMSLFNYDINLYKKNKDVDIPAYAYVMPLIIAFLAMLSGFITKRLGTDKNEAVTALKNTLFIFAFIAFIMIFTSIYIKISDPFATSVVHLSSKVSLAMIIYAFVIYLFTYIGLRCTKKRE